MGAKIIENETGLTIEGLCEMNGAKVNSHDDHRIAMACAVAALSAKGKTEISDVECVNKSYPSFFRDLKKLGGNVYDS
jgi:3-phosphoshikimate 1-carboxyvinyltransferase